MRKEAIKSVGVIVARFQIPSLHEGHRNLIAHVQKKHQEVLIVLGSSPLPLTDRDPLDYECRKQMVVSEFPGVIVANLEDNGSDEIWSKNLDEVIKLSFPNKKAILYGSRDCFIKYYSGQFSYSEFQQQADFNATEVRNSITPINSSDFRAGVIYASKMPFTTSYQVVDVAVLREHGDKVLLGQKHHDGNKFRFIGGFVDVSDASLEQAAKREVFEESSGLETDDYKYLGSARINDWRYRSSRHKVMSSFFVAKYIFGHPKASDDLINLQWVPVSGLEEILIDAHKPLLVMLQKHLVGNAKK